MVLVQVQVPASTIARNNTLKHRTCIAWCDNWHYPFSEQSFSPSRLLDSRNICDKVIQKRMLAYSSAVRFPILSGMEPVSWLPSRTMYLQL